MRLMPLHFPRPMSHHTRTKVDTTLSIVLFPGLNNTFHHSMVRLSELHIHIISEVNFVGRFAADTHGSLLESTELKEEEQGSHTKSPQSRWKGLEAISVHRETVR